MMRRIAISIFLLLLLPPGAAAVHPDPPPDSITDCRLSLKLKSTASRAKGQIWSLLLSPDGHVLVPTTGEKKTEIWNADTAQLIATVDGEVFRSEAFGPDGQTLATIKRKEVKLWNTTNGRLKHIFSGHKEAVSSLAFSPDGKSLATASEDGTVKLWDVETARNKFTLAGYRGKQAKWRFVARFFTDAAIAVNFSPDGKTLLTAQFDQPTKLWDAKSGRLEAVLGDKTSFATFSPSGRFVLTRGFGDPEPWGSGDTRLWETTSGKLKATLNITGPAFSLDDKWLGQVEYEGRKGLLNLDTMSVKTLTLPFNDFESWEGFSPDNQVFVLAHGLNDHRAAVIDVARGELVAELPIVAKQGFDFMSNFLKYAEQLSFHPGSRLLMGANQKAVRFWDTRSGHQIKELSEGRDPAKFNSDGKLLITTSQDKKSILFWKVILECD
jgi:WD40 repeat protein